MPNSRQSSATQASGSNAFSTNSALNFTTRVSCQLTPSLNTSGRAAGQKCHPCPGTKSVTYVMAPHRPARDALPRGHGVLIALEFGHEGAHRAQVQVAEVGARVSVREQGLGPLD